MKATVNDNCNGTASCAETCPQVFQLGSDGRAKVTCDTVPEAAQDACRQAAADCPFDAIEIQE